MNAFRYVRRFKEWFMLFRESFGRYRWHILSLALLNFVGSLLEGIGINSVIPVFAFINKSSERGTDFISQFIEKIFYFFHIDYTLRTLLLFIIGLFIIKALIVYIANTLSARIATAYEQDTRSGLFKTILRAGWPYLSKQKIGHLDQLLITDVNNSSTLLSYLSATLLTVASFSAYFLVAINISATIACLTLVTGLVIFLLFKPLFYRNRIISEQVESTYKKLAHFVNEAMLGIKTVKSLAVHDKLQYKADQHFESVRKFNIRLVSLRNVTTALLQPIGLIFVMAIFYFFYKLTAFNFASFAVIVYAINKIFSYLQIGQSQLHGISSLLPYTQSLLRARQEAARAAETDAGSKPFTFEHSLELRAVNFAYPGQTETLRNISFSVKKGEMLGIIGPSGAGKTTIVDILLRLLEPTSGEILLDSTPAAAIVTDDWRRHIGYVSQDPFLINDTIAANIRFFNGALNDMEVAEAARQANLYDFIEGLPDKFATVVGERGVRLSGGERQRIILARILARKPQILILDEATSALDNESEGLIQKSIEQLHGKITVIAIAHRLSTVMSADRLLAIEKGRIVETGSPKALLADTNSYFSKLVNLRTFTE